MALLRFEGFDPVTSLLSIQQELDRFLQAYAVERAKSEARRQGHSVTEQPLADGSIKLTIQLAGGATWRRKLAEVRV